MGDNQTRGENRRSDHCHSSKFGSRFECNNNGQTPNASSLQSGYEQKYRPEIISSPLEVEMEMQWGWHVEIDMGYMYML